MQDAGLWSNLRWTCAAGPLSVCMSVYRLQSLARPERPDSEAKRITTDVTGRHGTAQGWLTRHAITPWLERLCGMALPRLWHRKLMLWLRRSNSSRVESDNAR